MEILVEGTLVVVLDLSAQAEHHGISLAWLVTEQEFLVTNQRVDCFHVPSSQIVQLFLRVKPVSIRLGSDKLFKAEIPIG